jgi:hypothetical protein
MLRSYHNFRPAAKCLERYRRVSVPQAPPSCPALPVDRFTGAICFCGCPRSYLERGAFVLVLRCHPEPSALPLRDGGEGPDVVVRFFTCQGALILLASYQKIELLTLSLWGGFMPPALSLLSRGTGFSLYVFRMLFFRVPHPSRPAAPVAQVEKRRERWDLLFVWLVVIC